MKFIPLCLLALTSAATAADQVLVEAESFRDAGGWVLDTQFIESMGSPYLLAHGMGEAVKDAATTVHFPSTGKYHVWVRTLDWVARWKAQGAPGKFQLLVDGTALAETFGAKGASWGWQEGGVVDIAKADVALALHDLTGFEGRCDAIYFSKENTAPDAKKSSDPNDPWRRTVLGLPLKPEDAGSFDLVVIGGGYGGTAAAISAARMGCKVALVQDRAVLGGNGSSEVRVWAMGGTRRGLYPELGGIVEEFQDVAKASPGTFAEFGDDNKEKVVREEKNITLFFNHHVTAVEMSAKGKIAAVVALDTKTSAQRRFAGRFFCDATGHATVAALAGADITVKEEGHMGMSNMWRWAQTQAPAPFPTAPWALPLDMDDFPYPQRFHAEWFWESGFNKHPILGLEDTRDWNFRAIYGAWNAMKNGGGKAEHTNAKLEWVAYIGGTRESRQVLGDVVLTRDDIADKKPFPDGTVPTTWDIDLHYPKEQFAKDEAKEDPFISKAVFGKGVDRKQGYPLPYRCFYSRNVENLFTAGRCISVTHEALGTVRVMKTGGMIGEVVGKAASICIRSNVTPREVYERYYPELQTLMRLPAAARRATVNDEPKLPAGYVPTPPAPAPATAAGIAVSTLPGLAMDDSQAKLTGKWTEGSSLPGYFGAGYRYRGAREEGTARYEFKISTAGRYEVRLSFAPHVNRATSAPVSIESADGKKTVTVNQRVAGPLEKGFASLGTYQFAPGKPAAVVIGDGTADGNIHADAVQLVPVK